MERDIVYNASIYFSYDVVIIIDPEIFWGSLIFLDFIRIFRRNQASDLTKNFGNET